MFENSGIGVYRGKFAINMVYNPDVDDPSGVTRSLIMTVCALTFTYVCVHSIRTIFELSLNISKFINVLEAVNLTSLGVAVLSVVT